MNTCRRNNSRYLTYLSDNFTRPTMRLDHCFYCLEMLHKARASKGSDFLRTAELLVGLVRPVLNGVGDHFILRERE